MAASAIWNYGAAATNPQLNVHPMSTAQDMAADSSNEASISANDFLTLLVTEMKNQDPTAATDPNEYINQLVQVNSLQQLISINQTLTASLGVSGSSERSGSGSPTGQVAQSPHSPNNVAVTAGRTPGVGAANSAQAAPPGVHARISSGNLGAPDAVPAAQRVAQALGGRTGRQ